MFRGWIRMFEGYCLPFTQPPSRDPTPRTLYHRTSYIARYPLYDGRRNVNYLPRTYHTPDVLIIAVVSLYIHCCPRAHDKAPRNYSDDSRSSTIQITMITCPSRVYHVTNVLCFATSGRVTISQYHPLYIALPSF